MVESEAFVEGTNGGEGEMPIRDEELKKRCDGIDRNESYDADNASLSERVSVVGQMMSNQLSRP